jgi:hypothetical protein
MLLLFFIFLHTHGHTQNIISGIVVDSVSLTGIPNVSIKIKNSPRGTTSTTTGSFIIMAADFDTLIFTSIGFDRLYYPLFGPETDILIRIKGNVTMLKEVSVTATAIKEVMVKSPPRYTKSDGSYIKALSLADGISSPFTYFSGWEREKRKLLRMREENKKIRTYIDVVNDPALRNEIMKKYSLTEKNYYEILANFNQDNRDAAYLDNAEYIKKLLLAYYKSALR